MGLGNVRKWRRLDAVAVVGLIGWLAFDLTARTVFGAAPWPQSVVDYRILYDASRHVVATHEYPTTNPYPYPPPAVAVHAVSAAMPFALAAPLWLALTGLAAGASYSSLARVLGLHRQPGMLLVLPLAHGVVAYYFQWDMRSINCNLLVLAALLFGCAALIRERNPAAGFWFALSVALKVLPVLVLPYLAWTRRWRALAWATGFSLVFWVGVPLVAFGADGSRAVYTGWMNQLTLATDSATKNVHPILISLNKAAAHATGNATAATAIVVAVSGLWVVVGLAGAAASWGKRSRDGFAVLAHVSLLVLGPVAVNPYLEPYHLVALVVPTVLLLAAAADTRQLARVRVVAALGFALGMGILKLSCPWPLRGLLVNAQALVLCGIALWVAHARVVNIAPAGTTIIAATVRLGRVGRVLQRLLDPAGVNAR